MKLRGRARAICHTTTFLKISGKILFLTIHPCMELTPVAPAIGSAPDRNFVSVAIGLATSFFYPLSSPSARSCVAECSSLSLMSTAGCIQICHGPWLSTLHKYFITWKENDRVIQSIKFVLSCCKIKAMVLFISRYSHGDVAAYGATPCSLV